MSIKSHTNNLLIKCVLILVIQLILAAGIEAQTNNASALQQKLNIAKSDTERVNLYYAFSRLYWNKNTDSVILMADKSLALAEKIHFEKGIALASLSKGIGFVSAQKYPDALDCHFRALRISEKLKLPGLTANAYNNIGIVYTDMNNVPKAIYYYKQSLNIALQFHDETVYSTSSLLINIGDLYKVSNQFDSAIAYTSLGLEKDRKAKDSLGMAIALFNISENYTKQNKFEEALPFLKESQVISKKINDTEGLAFCSNAYALSLHHYGDYSGSIDHAKRGLTISVSLGINEVTKSSYNILYLNYLKLNDYKKALEYRNLGIAFSDSLNLAERDLAIKNIAADYDLEKKQTQIDLLQKDKLIKQKEFDTIKLRRNILSAGTLLLALIVFFLFRSYRQKKSLNKQLKKRNEEMVLQNRELEELNELKNKLFSIVSHDLRGPIGSVRSMMELMQSDMVSEEESKMIIPRLSDSMLQTSHLLDNLLYWAKSQMEGMQVNPKHFDVLQVISQNIKLIQGRANQKKVAVQMNRSTEVLWVHADETMTDIVVRNLLENAVKFSRAGETIIVNTEKDNTMVTVSVADHGKGIPYEHQVKIFNKLTSHTTFGTAREKGSGLGLLLCKELVETNKGKIGFVSKPDEGSTFSFTIPLHKSSQGLKGNPASAMVNAAG